MNEIIQLKKIRKSFGKLEVLREIDLSVKYGEKVVILGSSGSGKSTLLRCVNFLEVPTSGRVFIDGKPVGKSSDETDERVSYSERELNLIRVRIGMVFQQFNLFPHLTVLDNVALGPRRVLGIDPQEARERAFKSLKKVGLGEKVDAYPERLSGGQQQRAAIARALAMEPKAMLFDEPTSALDPELVSEVLTTIRQLAEEGMTMMIVTHELGFAYNVADRVVFLHEGKITEENNPRDFFLNTVSSRAKEFIRSHTEFRIPVH